MDYKNFAITLAKDAGKIIKQNFTLGTKEDWRDASNPVTATDIAINKLVLERIQKQYPTHSIQSEEESLINQESQYQWSCDPLDGTVPFAHGLVSFAFSIALVKDGQSILGVVYDPIVDRLFFAQKNQGAYLNDKRIKVNSSPTLKRNIIELIDYELADYHIWPLFEKLSMQGAIVMKTNSLALSGSLIAAGEYTAAIFPDDSAHDVAALKIIVEEAGGKVTDLFGNDQRYDQDVKGAIISNGKVHDFLVNEVSKVLK